MNEGRGEVCLPNHFGNCANFNWSISLKIIVDSRKSLFCRFFIALNWILCCIGEHFSSSFHDLQFYSKDKQKKNSKKLKKLRRRILMPFMLARRCDKLFLLITQKKMFLSSRIKQQNIFQLRRSKSKVKSSLARPQLIRWLTSNVLVERKCKWYHILHKPQIFGFADSDTANVIA